MQKKLLLLVLILCLAVTGACALAEDAASTLTLPNDLVEIGAEAFSCTEHVDTVVLPDSLMSIGSRAFADSSISSINLHDGLTDIAPDAFDGCDQLIATVFPGSYALDYCITNSIPYHLYTTPADQFTYQVLTDTTIQLTGYSGKDTLVVVPSEIDGYSVTELGYGLFMSKRNITKIILPDTLTVIGHNAFYNCDSLTRITVPEGVRMLDTAAFYQCDKLEWVDLPDSLETIRSSAFEGCASLTGFDYPMSLQFVNYSCFSNCPNFTSMVIPEGVEKIPEYLFYLADSLESITLPSTLVEIGNSAFSHTSLSSIVIPEGVTTIGDHVFAACASLTDVSFPSTLVSIGEGVFVDCTGLTELTFLDGLDAIGHNAFEACTALEYVHLPDSVTSLGLEVFMDCVALKEFDYPWSLESIGGSTFYNCKLLTKMSLPEGLEKVPAYMFSGANCLEEVTLPSSITSIGDSAFNWATALTKVNIPEGVTEIGHSAFRGCSALTELVFPSALERLAPNAFESATNLTELSFQDGLKFIGEYCFARCSKLETINLPDSVQQIDEYAFAYCPLLKNLNYPVRLHTVYGSSFRDCESLKKIVIPEGVTSIPSRAFYYVDYLEEIILPSTLTRIGTAAFQGCVNLKEMTLPSNLTIIGESAFRECTSMTKINIPASVERIEGYAFIDCDSLKELSLPNGETWLQYSNFSSCDSLEVVHLPDDMKEIRSGQFTNCVSLHTINYPKGLESVTGSLFSGCTSLASVSIPEGVTYIPSYVFYGANGLQSVSFPSTLRTIKADAFSYCTAMSHLYIPTHITNLESKAFDGCSALTIESEYGSAAIRHAINEGINYYYLSLTGRQIPKGTLYLGHNFSVLGYVRSTENVTAVKATLYNSDKSEVLQQVSLAPDVANFNLRNGVTGAFDFSSLALGKYCFVLEASTSYSSETLADTTFTVVPEPLRVYLNNYMPFSGYHEHGEDLAVTGTVDSNYPITHLEVQFLYDGESPDGTEGIAVICSPDTKSFDLADSLANLSSLPAASYTMQIYIESNGESRTLGQGQFSISNITIPEGVDVDYDKMISFIQNERNGLIFSSYLVDYLATIEENMSTSDKALLMLASSKEYSNSTLKGAWMDLIDGETHNTNQYRVDLYKKEICAFIATMDDEPTTSSKAALWADIEKLISSNVKVTASYLEELGHEVTEYDKDFINTMVRCSKRYEDVIDSAKVLAILTDGLKTMYMDYSTGLELLDCLSTDVRFDNANYQEAVSVLKERYSDSALNAMGSIFDNTLEFAIEKGTDAMLDHFLKAIGGPYYVAFNVVKLANTVLDEIFDIYGDSNDYRDYEGMCQTFQNARYAYQNHFTLLLENPEDEELLARLLSDFKVTKHAGLRAFEQLLDMKHYDGINYDSIEAEMNRLKNLTLPFLLD